MCEQLQEIEAGKLNPLRATGFLAEEIVYDRHAGGGGTVEIDPASFTFHEGDLRMELGHEDLWPHSLMIMLFVKGEVKAGEGRWDEGAQAYILTTKRRCKAYGLNPDDLDVIGQRLREEVAVYRAYLNPAA